MPRKKSEELGKREKDILSFIEKQIKENGYPPSVREIGKSVGLSSTATVHGYLTKLEQKGYIKKENQKGRTLRLLKGTKNCATGEHTWLFADNWIYDTTLMLVIKCDYAKIFGYIEENIYDPKCDLIYCAEKEYIRNRNFSVKQRVRKRNY